MAKILRTVGGGFRLVGPLTVANALLNPSFESGLTNWTAVDTSGLGHTTITATNSRAKFGTTSCRVDVTSPVDQNWYGISQTLADCSIPGGTYTFSAWLFLPSDLVGSSAPTALLQFYDSANVDLEENQSIQLTLGHATPDWVKVSFTTNTIPDNTASVVLTVAVFVNAVSQPTFSFYIDGMRWTQGTDTTYLDGDYAGYVWSGAQYDSTTLLSTAPDALTSFRDDVHSGTPQHVVT